MVWKASACADIIVCNKFCNKVKVELACCCVSGQGKQSLRVEKQPSDKVYSYPEILNRGCQVGSRWSPCHIKNTLSFLSLPNTDLALNEFSSLSECQAWCFEPVSNIFLNNLSLYVLMLPNPSRRGRICNSCGPLCMFEQCSH